MEAIRKKYRREFILKSKGTTKEAVLREVGTILCEKGVVKESFVPAIIGREANYPTGIDLSPIAVGLPNVAIPHTDPRHCKDELIVFVKLERAVTFYNMMQPDEALAVNYLFMIINDQPQQQTSMLAELMDFMTQSEKMQELDQLNTTEAIYGFLTSKRSEAHD